MGRRRSERRRRWRRRRKGRGRRGGGGGGEEEEEGEEKGEEEVSTWCFTSLSREMLSWQCSHGAVSPRASSLLAPPTSCPALPSLVDGDFPDFVACLTMHTGCRGRGRGRGNF